MEGLPPEGYRGGMRPLSTHDLGSMATGREAVARGIGALSLRRYSRGQLWALGVGTGGRKGVKSRGEHIALTVVPSAPNGHEE